MDFDSKKTIFLIDGSSFLYRAYYSLRPLHTPDGIPVQAVYGFCRMIKKLINTFDPKYIALVWDSKGETTRHEMFKDYKATRQAPPSDLFDQKKYVVEFARLIGLKQLEQKGIEADDIMFSISKEQAKKGNAVVFITSDKDMGQALNDQIYLYDTFKDTLYNKEKFEEARGFPIEKMPFFYALLGDVSDNIPGVKGIGKKTALDLVNQFKSLEDLYANLDEIPKARIKNALVINKKNAFLSYDLFLLQYNPTELSKKDLSFHAEDWKKACPLFTQLNFKSLLKECSGNTREEKAETIAQKIDQWEKADFKMVTTVADLDNLVAYLKEKKAFAFDTETTGLDPLEADLVGISFCAELGKAFYVPCNHDTTIVQLSKDKILSMLKPVFQDSKYQKYAHNAKYDQLVLKNHGILLQGLAQDTLIAAKLVLKGWQRVGLKHLSEYYFNTPMLSYDEVVKHHNYKNFSEVPLELATLYSCADSHQTFQLATLLSNTLKKEKLYTLYQDIEHPLIQVLCEMEQEGVYLDVTVLQVLDKAVTKELMILEEKIITLVGQESGQLNLNSPRQIEELLFHTLKLPPQKKSSTGHYSTDQGVLDVLAQIHPVPGLILKHRELSKLKNTYIDALPTYINKKTNAVHTTFSQTIVATGRLSSFNPNLQNIPAGSTGKGLEVRAAFKPKDGNIFIAADYSQIELRVLAYLSQDQRLLQAFESGSDIHAETAARLFDVPFEKVTQEQRQLGKRINFSILYGLTPYGLSKDLNIPFSEAKQYIEKYFEQYPDVSAWMEQAIFLAKEKGYVQTHWGRRRYVPNIYEKNQTLYEEARRIAINTIAQGTAADIMKKGMINLAATFKKNKLDAQILLQIHDELLISVAKKDQAKVTKIIKQVLESVVDWNVPLLVSTSSGSNWKEVTK
ncbi:MAG: DNA polymerase I [Candidatus Babeliales bacterium]